MPTNPRRPILDRFCADETRVGIVVVFVRVHLVVRRLVVRLRCLCLVVLVVLVVVVVVLVVVGGTGGGRWAGTGVGITGIRWINIPLHPRFR